MPREAPSGAHGQVDLGAVALHIIASKLMDTLVSGLLNYQ
jgi:hypothetical protein